jgi:hypothetical protein
MQPAAVQELKGEQLPVRPVLETFETEGELGHEGALPPRALRPEPDLVEKNHQVDGDDGERDRRHTPPNGIESHDFFARKLGAVAR